MSPAAHPPLTGFCPGLEERLAPFARAGALGPLERHLVDRLGRAGGEDRPDVLLALALAAGAPRSGHVTVDLEALGPTSLLPEARDRAPGAPAPASLPWPEDREGWIQAVAESPLVATSRDPGGAEPFVLDGSRIYTRRLADYEFRLARALRARARTRLEPNDPELFRRGLKALFPLGAPLPEGELDRQQLAAVFAALRGLTLLTGGPGTGKTSTVRAVLALLWCQRRAEGPASDLSPLRVGLAAPTGKAAARLTESLRSGLTPFLQKASGALPPGATLDELRSFYEGLRPQTLHRLLVFQRARPTRFRHDRERPLPHDVVVVDEASMIDLALMAKLVDAVRPTSRLLLLGDPHQLASVGAGSVLADMLDGGRDPSLVLTPAFAKQVRDASGLTVRGRKAAGTQRPLGDCTVALVHNHRFPADSPLGRLASAVLTSEDDPAPAFAALPELSDAPDAPVGRLAHGARGALPAEARRRILAGYRPYLERLLAGPRPNETLEAFHAAVLEAFGRFRVLCAHRRGALGVAGFNERIERLLARELAGFVPEDPFYLGRPILVRRNDYVVRRYNGDFGIVVENERGERTVAFPGEDGRVEYLAPVRLPLHQTVFAMTIHKSQGSEFDEVLVVLPAHSSPILTRELLYTGVTRGRKRVALLSSDEILAETLKRRVERASGLSEALRAQASDGGRRRH